MAGGAGAGAQAGLSGDLPPLRFDATYRSAIDAADQSAGAARGPLVPVMAGPRAGHLFRHYVAWGSENSHQDKLR